MTKNKFFKSLALSAVLFLGTAMQAQVKLGDNPTTINADAILEMEHTTKGMLLPRITLSSTTSFAPLTAHVAGMVVYNTATAGDVTPGYYYNDGAQWLRLPGIKGSQVADTTNDSWIDTASNTVLKSGRVGIGTTTPDGNLTVQTEVGASKTNTNTSDSTSFSQFRATSFNKSTYLYQIGKDYAPSGIYTPSTAMLYTGDTLSMVTNSASPMKFLTSSAERMRIDANGNVGIGTTTPTHKLHIRDSFPYIAFQDIEDPNGSVGAITAYQSGAMYYDANRYLSATPGSHVFRVGSGGILNTAVIIDTAGKVGIGGNSPTNMLDVNGSARVRTLSSASSSDSVVTADATGVLRRMTMSSLASALASSGTSVWNDLATATGATSLTQNIYHKGRVDIGFDTAQLYSFGHMLNVKNHIGTKRFNSAPNFVQTRYNGVEGAHTGVLKGEQVGTLTFEASDGASARPTIANIFAFAKDTTSSTSSAGELAFATTPRGTTVPVRRMTIDEIGNVGIGTATPVERLDVAGVIRAGASGATNGQVVLRDVYSAGSLMTLGNMRSSGGAILGYGVKPSSTVVGYLSSSSISMARTAIEMNSSGVMFSTGATSVTAIDSSVTMTERVRITNDGNVGIGTTTPNLEGGNASSKYLTIASDGTNPNGTGRVELVNTITPVAASQQIGRLVMGNSNNGTSQANRSLVSIVGFVDGTNDPTNGFGGSLGFYTKLNTSASTSFRMLLDQNGNLGIGTITPAERLTVGSGGKLRLNRSDNAAGHTIFYESPDDLRFYNGNGGAFKFGSNTVAEMVTISSTGNVGIGTGTSVPTSKLQVVGIPAYASDAAAGTAGLTAGAFWQTSGHATLPNGVLMVKQ